MNVDFLNQDIWISPYRLRAKGLLNQASKRREFEGTLIRIGNGYGCIHPWPELGDPPLQKCLEDLKGRKFWPIVRRALRCAEYDQAARDQSESLFEEMEVPKSHATISEINLKQIELAVEAGFDRVKIKMGSSFLVNVSLLEKIVAQFPLLRIRLDFNETLDPASAEEFLRSISPSLKSAIDFIEDICPYSDKIWDALWKKFRVPLAVDREATPMAQSAQVIIIKPAVDEPFPLVESALMLQKTALITSYMDHPLGQAFAAWEAARMNLIFPGSMGDCGLQTHSLFENDAFVEQLGEWKPEFTIPAGTGLGFDEALSQLSWRKI